MSKVLKCPDPECEKGMIKVYNAYNPDPLLPEFQPCDTCNGTGFMFYGDDVAIAK